MTRWMVLLTSVLALGGCLAGDLEWEPVEVVPDDAVSEPAVEVRAHMRLTWRPDGAAGCVWSGALGAAADMASDLWAEWGVEVVRDDLDPAAASLCQLAAGEPVVGYAGYSSLGDNRIDLASYVVDPMILTHEFGHLILIGRPHLPEGEMGIMASMVAMQPAAMAWSPADARHLREHGLEAE